MHLQQVLLVLLSCILLTEAFIYYELKRDNSHLEADNKLNYVGCFKDNDEKRDLQRDMYRGPLVVSTCRQFCRLYGYDYAGLQNSDQCFCGNSYGQYGKSNDCNKNCFPYKTQICGGNLANSVYSVGRKYSKAITSKMPSAKYYIGCFKENTEDRDLPRKLDHSIKTVERCRSTCGTFGYRYAGVTSYECRCGHSFGKHGRSDSCTRICLSNFYEICGGRQANSVFLSYSFSPKVRSDGFIGCYKDSSEKREFERLLRRGDVNVKWCRHNCLKTGYSFSALQNSNECWCSYERDSFGMHGSANNCNKKCSGNTAEVCGGELANSVYFSKRFDEPVPAKVEPAKPKKPFSMADMWAMLIANLKRHYKAQQAKLAG